MEVLATHVDLPFREVPEGKSAFAVKGIAGDTKTIWDRTKATEVEAARELFNSLIKKGYAAFSVDKNGEKGEHMTAFDANAERVIFSPALQGG